MNRPFLYEGEIEREEYALIKGSGRRVQYTKKLYVECVCSAREHVARVIFMRELEETKKNGVTGYYVVGDDVYFEFNLTEGIEPSNDVSGANSLDITKNPLKTLIQPVLVFGRRIQAAWNVIRGNPVHLCTDLLLDHKSATELARRIEKIIKEMESLGLER